MIAIAICTLVICLVTENYSMANSISDQKPTLETEFKTAVFAGGCFWCMQYAFDRVKGVKQTKVGYTGGTKPNPTYREVVSGTTGYAEAIEITYDPQEVSYADLLKVFWQSIDPTAVNKQFADVGTQYRTAIFYQNEAEKKIAEASKKKLQESGKFERSIATQIVPAKPFYPAEDYHQKYYLKNPGNFKDYEKGSGRVDYLKKVWEQD